MDSFDTKLAVISAILMSSKLDELKEIDFYNIPHKKIKGLILKYWGFVYGTNAYEKESEAYELITRFKEENEGYAYWCWYTACAIEFSQMIKRLATEYKIELPKPHTEAYSG
jgi:hypothetical protein